MSDGLTTTILGLLIVLSGIGAGAYLWINRPRGHAHDETPRVQPLFGSEQAKAMDLDAVDEPVRSSVAERSAAATVRSALATGASAPPRNGRPVVSSSMPPSPRPLVAAPAMTASPAPVAGASPMTASSPTASSPTASSSTASSVTPAPSAPIRMRVPTDGTLQFLPGRLEMIGGSERGREVRFVRPPSFEAPTVTFGRSDGEPYRHVQLADPTVSRQHARMVMTGQEWRLTNLSTTNPVTYNGRVLAPDEEVPLADGDRIEMGEVVFRFRAR